MKSLAIVYPDSIDPGQHERLLELCREVGFTVDLRESELDPEVVSQSLPEEAHVLFIPLGEEDCVGVKTMQLAQLGDAADDSADNRHHPIVVLYGSSLPSAGYLSLAFREGADDVIALESDKNQLVTQVRRALTHLRTLQREIDLSQADAREARTLASRCEDLERESTRWQERVHILARTAAALAIGDMRPADNQPTLLIVGRSEAMTKVAIQCAEELHYRTGSAVNAKEALERMARDPADVVLSDVRLTDADAPGLAVQIRAAVKDRSPYFIAWSSDEDAESWLLEPNQGMDDFVLKRSDSGAKLLLSAALLRGMAP